MQKVLHDQKDVVDKGEIPCAYMAWAELCSACSTLPTLEVCQCRPPPRACPSDHMGKVCIAAVSPETPDTPKSL